MTKIEPNAELSFLYKKCKNIKPLAISLMARVPEFQSALKAHDGVFSDEVVYEIIKATYVEMLKNNSECDTAGKVISLVSRDVTGNSSTWKEDLPDELIDKIISHKGLKYSVSSKHLYKVCCSELLANAFRENNVKDDYQAYEVLKDIFFPMICDNYKNGDDPEKRKLYFSIRRIVEAYAESLTGDPKAWRKDYNLRTQTIQKAARDGTFEKIELSQSQLKAELLADRMLPDADDDL